MKITYQDRSLYFKGLLLLIAKDRAVTVSERQLMMRIGKALDFEKEFCEKAVDEILENRHITNDPPAFSSMGIAAKFVMDGLTLATADGVVHPDEVIWLRIAAERNGLDTDWFESEMKRSSPARTTANLEVDHLLVG